MRSVRAGCAASIVVFFLAAEAATAERPVTIGDRVRVTAPSVSPKRIEGTLAGVDAESLTVFSGESGRTIAVPRSEVRKFEVTRERKSRWATGALVGAAWGVGLGVLASNPPSASQEFQVDGGAVVGGMLVGASLGALIGVALHTDRWTTVPVSAVAVGIGPVRGGGVAVAFRVKL